MNGWQRKEIPPWCLITEAGRLLTPKGAWAQVPGDCARCLDLRWDGIHCRADYFTWHYGEVYRYSGKALPVDERQWKQDHYVPSTEMEVLIIRLATANTKFAQIEQRVKRPRAEICAILQFHGYAGWACFIHGDVTTYSSYNLPAFEN